MQYFFNFEKIAYLEEERPDGCILCLIRDKSSEVKNMTLYQNDLYNISLNLYPYNPGHVILFPLRHIEDVRQLSDQEQKIQSKMLHLILDVVEGTHSPTAFNVGCNMGLDAGASIKHLHYHVIPRYPHETGIADLIAGKRVLVEHPEETAKKLKAAISNHPLSNFTT